MDFRKTFESVFPDERAEKQRWKMFRLSYRTDTWLSSLWQSPADPNCASFSSQRNTCIRICISPFVPHFIDERRAQLIMRSIIITCVAHLEMRHSSLQLVRFTPSTWFFAFRIAPKCELVKIQRAFVSCFFLFLFFYHFDSSLLPFIFFLFQDERTWFRVLKPRSARYTPFS